jgi:DnaJ like chaperone protein
MAVRTRLAAWDETMAIWALLVGGAAGLALGGPLGALGGAAVGGAVDVARRRAAAARSPQVAFTIAAIALAAKMARADGYASDREFALFQRLFEVPADERANADRFYRLAQRSTDGFEAYARQAADLLGAGSPLLEDLIEALLMIAVADGADDADRAFLDRVAELFGLAPSPWAGIRARHLGEGGADGDPWAVLGIAPGASAEAIGAAYRRLARTCHPDRHIALGTPVEFIRVAEARMAAINNARDRLLKGTRA